MPTKEQLAHGFMFMYEKDGYYYGSYDLFPSKDDVKLIKVAIWRGHESPEPTPTPSYWEELDQLNSNEQDQLVNRELY